MVVLVDFENVNEKGLAGITKLTKDDTLIIFYNDSLKISFDVHRSIEKLECSKRYQKITDKTANALDFLLVTILGDLIANDSESKYAIISNDNGFDVVVKYWKSKGVEICKKPNILNVSQQNNTIDQPASNATEQNVKMLFEGNNSINDVDHSVIANFIDKYKTKQGLNNALLKEYGSEKTGLINKIIKPLIKDKKGK